MEKNKHVYIVHCWGSDPDGMWYPWLKQELIKRGYETTVLEMPDTDHPRIDTWVPHLAQAVKDPGPNTILVGHSMGGPTILHYLASLPDQVRVGKAVLVAPAIGQITNLDEVEQAIARVWRQAPLDPDQVKRSVTELVAFFSDNDEYIPLETERLARELFGARTIIEHDKHHYGEQHGFTEVPSVLEEVVR